jgi:rfaE bifunctional protein kinase chain/domain
MIAARFREITSRYPDLRIAVIGDFCLDRYLEIDPRRAEVSIETGLPVHNVVRVRPLPGGAGTIVNNLCALGVGAVHLVGFVGDDGEGYELRRALASLSGVETEHLLQTPERRTFTYCKPLVVEEGMPPRELNRLDSKNWTPTPELIVRRLASAIAGLGEFVDAMIIMDQVDVAETGVVTRSVRDAVHTVLAENAKIVALADSRRGLTDFPPLAFKMNAPELAVLTGTNTGPSIESLKEQAASLALQNRQPVFVTLAERGIVGASPAGATEHIPAFPVRGTIDIVGAGDSVTAGLAAALAAGAAPQEAMLLAMAAASTVIHQLGTTGTASLVQIGELLF